MPIFCASNFARRELYSWTWFHSSWSQTWQCFTWRQCSGENLWFWTGHSYQWCTFITNDLRNKKLHVTRNLQSARLCTTIGHMGCWCRCIYARIQLHTISTILFIRKVRTDFEGKSKVSLNFTIWLSHNGTTFKCSLLWKSTQKPFSVDNDFECFLRATFQKDATIRPTADQCLDLDFFTKHNIPDHLPLEILTNEPSTQSIYFIPSSFLDNVSLVTCNDKFHSNFNSVVQFILIILFLIIKLQLMINYWIIRKLI